MITCSIGLKRHGMVAIAAIACASMFTTPSAHAQAELTPPVAETEAATPPAPTLDTSSDQALPEPADPWTVQIRPWVWYVGPDGDLRLPRASGATGALGTVDLADINADSTRLRPAGDLDIAADRFLFSFSAMSYELSRSGESPRTGVSLGGISITPTQRFDLSFEYAAFELTLGYRFLRHDFQAASAHPQDAVPVVVSLYGVAGGRLHDLSIDFRRAGANTGASYDELVGEGLLGGRIIAEFTPQFGIDVLGSVGYLPGDPNSLSVDIRAGFSWMPISNVGLQIGYRQLLVDIEDGDGPEQFSFDGGFAGVFTGLVVRF